MFDNIGSKLQRLATVVCWLGIIASVISGIAAIASGGNALAAIVAMILGGVGSWIGSWVTYAIGEIAEGVEQLKYQMAKNGDRGTESSSSLARAAAAYDKEKRDSEWTCVCGAQNSNGASYCFRCRRPRSEADAPKIACPHCGAMNRNTNTTCFACNEPLQKEWNPAEPGFVNCPRCGKRMSVDFIKARKKCPDCGRPYVPAEPEE